MRSTTSLNVMTARLFRYTFSLALTALVGCASRGYERASATGAGIEALKTELAAAKERLDASVSALDKVVAAEDPSVPYEEFSHALADMEGQADTIRAQAEAVRSAGDAYFSEWEAKLASFTNEDMRAMSEKRRADLVASFDEINAASQKTKDAYEPLMTNLNDIKEYLGLDLSAASVGGIRNQVAQVKDGAGKVKETIDNLLGALDELSSQLATGAAAEAPEAAESREPGEAEAPAPSEESSSTEASEPQGAPSAETPAEGAAHEDG